MVNFQSFTGVISKIENIGIGMDGKESCNLLMSVENAKGRIINFVILPTTYFVNHQMMLAGEKVTGFYDGNAPAPFIYPPQLIAIVMAGARQGQTVKVDRFNRYLLSSDGTLKLNIAQETLIVLENGQLFTRDPGNRDLIVVYGPTTRSIPAQTTPYEIIVMC